MAKITILKLNNYGGFQLFAEGVTRYNSLEELISHVDYGMRNSRRVSFVLGNKTFTPSLIEEYAVGRNSVELFTLSGSRYELVWHN